MRLRMTIVLFLVVIAAAGYSYQKSLNRQSVSDRQLILSLLQTGQTAAEKKDIPGVLALVSRNYRDTDGRTYPVVRLHVRDALTSEADVDVAVLQPVIRVTGQSATVTTRIVVTDLEEPDKPLFDGDVVIRLSKEKLRVSWVFSTRAWRVTAVEGISEVF